MLPIYIDLDDVLSETTRSFLKIFKREYGREVAFDQVTSFNLKDAFRLTQNEYDYFFDLIHEPEEILSYEPVDDAIAVLKTWAGKGTEIAVVTGRLTSTYESSLEWLDRHQVPYDSFIMVDKYSRPKTDGNIAISLEKLSKMKFSFAIEDSLSMAEYLSQDMETKVVLFDRPWNQSQSGNGNIERCTSWKQIDFVINKSLLRD